MFRPAIKILEISELFLRGGNFLAETTEIDVSDMEIFNYWPI